MIREELLIVFATRLGNGDAADHHEARAGSMPAVAADG